MQAFKATTVAQAQQAADALRHAAKLMGVPVPSHAQAQQVIAKENGFANWAQLKASQKEAVDQLLSQVEQTHVNQSIEAVMASNEWFIASTSGFSLRYAHDTSGLFTHARVVDPLGREIHRVTAKNVESAPLKQIGALLQCFGRHLHENPSLEGTTADRSGGNGLMAKLKDLCSVLINGQYFPVRWTDVDCTDNEEVVLELHVEEDGLDYEESLTRGQLMSLTWSDEAQAFVDSEGTTYEFFEPSKVTPAKL
ncbi:hypothetical protein LC612_36590 [Nostoc sp. CHAB 5834]|nr:hypothetical protein [Nostoc sp. CHAB 5834]